MYMHSSSQTRADVGCSICTSASKHQKGRKKKGGDRKTEKKKSHLTTFKSSILD